METLVWGNGFIASHLSYRKITDKITFEIDPAVKIIQMLDEHKPDVLINAIGYCGVPNIDACEKRKLYTFDMNCVVPVYLAQACQDRGVHLIHLSSGCIFNGSSPDCEYGFHDPGWNETHSPNPVSYYSKTKAAADMLMQDFSNTTLIRIRMPISSKPNPRNLLNKLISYKKVLEEPNSVTFLPDLVNCIEWVIQNKKYGIYNCCSPEPLKHSALLDEYKKYYPEHSYESITAGELDKMTVARRSNCIIDSSKIQSEGFKFGDTRERVRDCVKEFCDNLKKENNGK